MPAILFPRESTPGSSTYHDESNSSAILTSTGVLGGLALTAVLLRLYVRTFMLKYCGKDDVVMAMAMFFGVAVYICFIGESYHGMGRHASAITPHDMEQFLHWQFFHSLLLTVASTLAKIAIALLLIRLVSFGRMTQFLWCMIVFLAAYNSACFFMLVFACRPVAAYWSIGLLKSATCFSAETFTALGVANSTVSMLSDVVLALLPILIVRRLQLNRRTKTALCCVLGLGVIAVGAGAVKTHAQVNFLANPDRLFHNVFPVWAALELYTGILAASLPTLKPLLASFFSQVNSSSESSDQMRGERPIYLRKDSGLKLESPLSTQVFAEYCEAVSPPEAAYQRNARIFLDLFRRERNTARPYSTRSATISLGNVTWREESPLPNHNLDDKPKDNCIVRTTRVVTTSELKSDQPEENDDQWPLRTKTSVSSLGGRNLKLKNSRSVLNLSRSNTVDTGLPIHYIYEKE